MIEHDPDFYEGFDSDDFDDENYGDVSDLGDAYEFDTFDRIVDASEIYNDNPGDGIHHSMSSEHWGMAFALADELADEKSLKYELTRNTDLENFEQAMRLNPVVNKRISMVEDHVELTFDDLGIEEEYREDFESFDIFRRNY